MCDGRGLGIFTSRSCIIFKNGEADDSARNPYQWREKEEEKMKMSMFFWGFVAVSLGVLYFYFESKKKKSMTPPPDKGSLGVHGMHI